MVKFSENNKQVLDEIFSGIPGVRFAKAFGYPGYYLGKKMIACVYEEGLGIKLSPEWTEKMLGENRAIPFKPYGRHTMRQWVFIVHENPVDFKKDLDIFYESIQYISSLEDNNG
jgi:hypothetical protein